MHRQGVGETSTIGEKLDDMVSLAARVDRFSRMTRRDNRFRNETLPGCRANVGLTINVYIKRVTESQVNAMDALEAKFSETSDNLPTDSQRLVI